METAERLVVRRALDKLKPYLRAYVEQRVPSSAPAPAGRTLAHARASSGVDVQALVKTMLERWDDTFARELPTVVRSYLHEIRDIRNRWAHEAGFSPAEARRAVDTAELVGQAIGVRVAIPRSADDHRTTDPAPKTKAGLGRAASRVSQRDMMRSLHATLGTDHERLIQAYAAAERRGEVRRGRNKSGLSAEDYAHALLRDGLAKKWL